VKGLVEISYQFLLCVGLLFMTNGLLSCRHNRLNTKPSVHVQNNETPTPLVAISNANDKTLEIYHYASKVWDTSTCAWRFKPVATLGYRPDAIKALGAGIGDMRMHYTDGFRGRAISAFAIQGGRFLAIGAYVPQGNLVKGQKLWQYLFPADQDPNNHAIELLPNGNIAVAGYGNHPDNGYGNWIRIYNTATDTSSNYAEATLIGAHALLYDTVYHRLWAGGQMIVDGRAKHGIFAYVIGGSRYAPTIQEDTTYRTVFPFGKPTDPTGVPDALKWPHDLAPDYDDPNKLYYADHTGVYIYDKIAKTLTATLGDSHRFFGEDIAIKSVGKQARGNYVVTEAWNPGISKYHTNKVDFYDSLTGTLLFSRYVDGYSVYRARIWTPIYL